MGPLSLRCHALRALALFGCGLLASPAGAAPLSEEQAAEDGSVSEAKATPATRSSLERQRAPETQSSLERQRAPERQNSLEKQSSLEAQSSPETDGTAAAGPPEAADEFASSPSLEAARAQEREQEAKAAFRRGDRQYLEGDYEAAVASFEEAYALSGRIEMLFNLANAHERLDNYSEASLALRGYIPHAPAANREALEKRLSRLEDSAAQERRRARQTPAPVVIQPERVDREPVDVRAGVGIGLLTLGGAGLIAGTAFAVSAANARAQLGDECEQGSSGRLCPPSAESLIDRDRSHSLVADVAFIAGAACGATGLYLVLHQGKRGNSELRTSVGPGSVQLGGHF